MENQISQTVSHHADGTGLSTANVAVASSLDQIRLLNCVIVINFYNSSDPARFQSYKEDNYPNKSVINCYGLISSTCKTYSNYLCSGQKAILLYYSYIGWTVSSRYSNSLIYAHFGPEELPGLLRFSIRVSIDTSQCALNTYQLVLALYGGCSITPGTSGNPALGEIQCQLGSCFETQRSNLSQMSALSHLCRKKLGSSREVLQVRPEAHLCIQSPCKACQLHHNQNYIKNLHFFLLSLL